MCKTVWSTGLAATLYLMVNLLMPVTAIAAGYAVGQDSIAGAGTAHAGGAAAATNASTIYANPAGMTRLSGNQFSLGVHLIRPAIDFDNAGSRLADGSPTTGGEGGNGGQTALVPNAYLVYQLEGPLTFGLGINSPFGLVTKYDDNWLGRYSEVTTSLKTVNVNPSIAYRVNDLLSIGFGVNAQYVRAKLRQAIDFGSVCVAAIGAAACGGLGLAVQANDGTGYVSGWDVGFGYNAGILLTPTPATRIGVHYRSQLHYEVPLTAEFRVPVAARNFLTAAGSPNAFTNTLAQTDLTVPEQVSVSAYHDVNQRLAVMADVTWTRWRKFDQLRIEFAEPTTPDNVLETQWNDVFRVAAGATYQWNDRLTLRGGLAFDQSPIDNKFRGPGVPDSDRYVVAVGLGYQLSESMSVDVAYQHLFFADGKTRRVSTTNSVLIGEFDVDVDVASVGFNWQF